MISEKKELFDYPSCSYDYETEGIISIPQKLAKSFVISFQNP